MNKKQRKKRKEKARHDAHKSPDNPIPDSPIEQSNKGENGEQHRKETEPLKEVTRLSRFKQWWKTKWAQMTPAEMISVLLTFSIAGATAYYAVVAGHQWDAMKESNRINLRAMGVYQRAWIQVMGSTTKFDASDPDHVRVLLTLFFKNIGKTPARKIRAQVVTQNLLNSEAPTFEYSGKPRTTSTIGIAFPDEMQPMRPQLLEDDPNRPGRARERTLSRAEYQALVNGDAWIAIYASVEYEDAFHIQHWTHYCTWTALVAGRDVTAKSCTDYNNTDDQ